MSVKIQQIVATKIHCFLHTILHNGQGRSEALPGSYQLGGGGTEG